MEKRLLILVLLLTVAKTAGAVSFATQRLASIAKCMTLQGLDTLSAGTHESLYWLRKHPVCVRINRFDEVEHIGFRLFSEEVRKMTSSVVCDFLERDLLERNLPSIDGAIKHDLMYEQVWFIEGNAQTPFSFDGTEAYAEDRIDYRKYRATWSKDGRTLLRITLNMNYQMLTGCNAIELEQRFMTRLRRHERHEHSPVIDSLPANGPDVYVVLGDTFLIREMNNELLYEHDRTGWHLADSLSRPTRALRNMLTSMESRKEPLLQLTLDKYGYETEQLQTAYKDWLQMCQDDGCTPYFGIKQKTAEGYNGTVLMVNRQAGYLHMLSLSVDQQSMADSSQPLIRGRLYVYIPLHNVADTFYRKPTKKK